MVRKYQEREKVPWVVFLLHHCWGVFSTVWIIHKPLNWIVGLSSLGWGLFTNFNRKFRGSSSIQNICSPFTCTIEVLPTPLSPSTTILKAQITHHQGPVEVSSPTPTWRNEWAHARPPWPGWSGRRGGRPPSPHSQRCSPGWGGCLICVQGISP